MSGLNRDYIDQLAELRKKFNIQKKRSRSRSVGRSRNTRGRSPSAAPRVPNFSSVGQKKPAFLQQQPRQKSVKFVPQPIHFGDTINVSTSLRPSSFLRVPVIAPGKKSLSDRAFEIQFFDKSGDKLSITQYLLLGLLFELERGKTSIRERLHPALAGLISRHDSRTGFSGWSRDVLAHLMLVSDELHIWCKKTLVDEAGYVKNPKDLEPVDLSSDLARLRIETLPSSCDDAGAVGGTSSEASFSKAFA